MRTYPPRNKAQTNVLCAENEFQGTTTVIKKIVNTVVLPVALIAVVAGSSVQPGHAGVFDNLFNAANGALPTYGREASRANRQDLSTAEITAAIREALNIGADNVSERFSLGGYNDTTVRVELPRAWRKAQKIAARIGYSAEFDELENKLNIAAASAAPATRTLIKQFVSGIKLDDPRALLNSHDIAATHFLRQRVNDRLASRLKPIINQLLIEAGAVESSSKIEKRIRHLPMVKNLQTDLADHVVAESLDGFFHYMAREEQSIRINPASRTTDLLKKVFG